MGVATTTQLISMSARVLGTVLLLGFVHEAFTFSFSPALLMQIKSGRGVAKAVPRRRSTGSRHGFAALQRGGFLRHGAASSVSEDGDQVPEELDVVEGPFQVSSTKSRSQTVSCPLYHPSFPLSAHRPSRLCAYCRRLMFPLSVPSSWSSCLSPLDWTVFQTLSISCPPSPPGPPFLTSSLRLPLLFACISGAEPTSLSLRTDEMIPLGQGEFGVWFVDSHDALEVLTYRLSLVAASFSVAGGTGIALTSADPLVLDLCAVAFLVSFGVSIATVHIYMKPMHDFLKVRKSSQMFLAPLSSADLDAFRFLYDLHTLLFSRKQACINPQDA